MGKRGTLEDEMRALATDLVEDAHESASVSDAEARETDKVTTLFTRIPPNEGFYVKIYKRAPIPKEYGNKRMFLYDIPQPDLVPDMETELLRLAKLNDWGDGIYEACLFKTGERGVRSTMEVTLQIPKTPLPEIMNSDGSGQPQPSAMTQILETARVIKELNSTGSSNGSAAQAETVVRAVSDAYKAGADAAGKQPAPTPPMNIVEMITALKPLLAPPAIPGNPLTEAITLLKTLGLFEKKTGGDDDFFRKLILLKEAGLLGSTSTPVDPTEKAIALLSGILPLVERLTPGGAGGGEPASIGVELIRQLGPQVSKIIGDVTGTINNAIASKRGLPIRPELPLVSPSETPTLPAQVPSLESAEAPPSVSGSESESTREDSAMLPVFKPIKIAVENRDVNFFPMLEELLLKYGGASYEDLLDGKITVDDVIAYIVPLGGSFFASEHTKLYFGDFLAWAKAKKASMIVGKCVKCEDEFEFDNLESFTAEPNCPQCQTPLEQIVVAE